MDGAEPPAYSSPCSCKCCVRVNHRQYRPDGTYTVYSQGVRCDSNDDGVIDLDGATTVEWDSTISDGPDAPCNVPGSVAIDISGAGDGVGGPNDTISGLALYESVGEDSAPWIVAFPTTASSARWQPLGGGGSVLTTPSTPPTGSNENTTWAWRPMLEDCVIDGPVTLTACVEVRLDAMENLEPGVEFAGLVLVDTTAFPDPQPVAFAFDGTPDYPPWGPGDIGTTRKYEVTWTGPASKVAELAVVTGGESHSSTNGIIGETGLTYETSNLEIKVAGINRTDCPASSIGCISHWCVPGRGWVPACSPCGTREVSSNWCAPGNYAIKCYEPMFGGGGCPPFDLLQWTKGGGALTIDAVPATSVATCPGDSFAEDAFNIASGVGHDITWTGTSPASVTATFAFDTHPQPAGSSFEAVRTGLICDSIDGTGTATFFARASTLGSFGGPYSSTMWRSTVAGTVYNHPTGVLPTSHGSGGQDVFTHTFPGPGTYMATTEIETADGWTCVTTTEIVISGEGRRSTKNETLDCNDLVVSTVWTWNDDGTEVAPADQATMIPC